MFPYLDLEDRFQFPDPEEADTTGILASGGNLSPGMLLSAYGQGIFPWFNRDEPILWWSPDPRFVLYPGELHISKSMRRLLKKNTYAITYDQEFEAVIGRCAAISRPGQRGTWITSAMRDAYTALHLAGIAHSVEAWAGERLVGGLYGIGLGGVFCGESMFADYPNASKAAFITLVGDLVRHDYQLIDCQVHTPHLESLGAVEIPRSDYLGRLQELIRQPECSTSWSSWR
jgi:leucyl/phenylalanyl-tRNA---protein transferase